MGLLNLDKEVNISLNKENYLAGDIVKGNVNFNFGLEKIKIDKVILIFRKVVETKKRNYINGTYSYNTDRQTTDIINKTLKGSGEYKHEELEFEFQIPSSILPKIGRINKKLNEFLDKKQIKGISKKLIEMFASFITQGNSELPRFELEARLDIPWGKDVVSIKQIEIWESKENLD